MPAKSNITTTVVQLSSDTVPVSSGTRIWADAANPQTVYVGYGSDSATMTVVGNVSVTTNDAVNGDPLPAGGTLYVSKHLAASPSEIYVVTVTGPARVLYRKE